MASIGSKNIPVLIFDNGCRKTQINSECEQMALAQSLNAQDGKVHKVEIGQKPRISCASTKHNQQYTDHCYRMWVSSPKSHMNIVSNVRPP